jgi:hypothetical protein
MFAQRVLADLTRLTRDLSLSRRLKVAAGGAIDRVTDLLGALTVSYEGVELGYSPGRRSSKTPKQMLDDDLRDALREVGRLCQKSDHTGFILQYDEFQVVKEERKELTLSALLAATATVQREGIPVMLVLCGLPTILENLGRSKSYSERMFTVEHIGHLHPPEDRLAFTGPAEARGRRFTDQVVEAVLLDTQGYPFFIQLYGDTLWKGTNRLSSPRTTFVGCAQGSSTVSTGASSSRATAVPRPASRGCSEPWLSEAVRPRQSRICASACR